LPDGRLDARSDRLFCGAPLGFLCSSVLCVFGRATYAALVAYLHAAGQVGDEAKPALKPNH